MSLVPAYGNEAQLDVWPNKGHISGGEASFRQSPRCIKYNPVSPGARAYFLLGLILSPPELRD